MAEFVHLHQHTEYSLLDGATRIADLPRTLAAHGQKAMAITDHGSMYGVIDFYQAMKGAGLKPIIGCEVYVAQRTMRDKEPRLDDSPYHLVLLAEDQEGYRNLMSIVSANTPFVYRRKRLEIANLGHGFHRVIARYGVGVDNVDLIISISKGRERDPIPIRRPTGTQVITSIREPFQA